MSLIFGKNLIAEILLKVLTDYEDDFAKTSLDGVVDRVVHNGLPIGTQTVELLEPTVAASHTSRKK